MAYNPKKEEEHPPQPEQYRLPDGGVVMVRHSLPHNATKYDIHRSRECMGCSGSMSSCLAAGSSVLPVHKEFGLANH